MQPTGSRRVSIVIPIYNARAMTERCIGSVRQHARGDWRLILVNDCSTEPGLGEALRRIAAEEPRVTLLENPANLGFVKTANAGLRAAGGDDVLLLNSDTEVFEDFLGRIVAAAHADARTGIVTAFSNNATLCSIPIPFQDNDIPQGLTPAEMNALVSSCSLHERPELPTAVGFCMFIRNEVFADTGYFDEESYGRGFGEENDLCEMAKEAGWKIRLADDVFVYHKGKASFGTEGGALEQQNAEILEDRHPGYHQAIRAFIAHNPLEPLHRRIRLQLLRSKASSAPAMLFLVHKSPFVAKPGGTEFHLLDLVRNLRLPRAIIAFPQGRSLVAAEVISGSIGGPILYSFRLPSAMQQFSLQDRTVERLLRRLLRIFGIAAAHVHHLMYWPLSVGRVLRESGVPFAYTGHDYFTVCPNWNLFDSGRAQVCPCDDSPSCGQSCLPGFFADPAVKAPSGFTSLLQYRDLHRAESRIALSAASLVIFPSKSTRDRTESALGLDLARSRVIEHGYAPVVVGQRPPEARGAGSRALRLLVLGEVGVAVKGSANYLALVERTRDLRLEWHFVGSSPELALQPMLEERAPGHHAVFHGRVEREQLFATIARIAPDLAVLMPACHETFPYALSELMIAGIPVLVNDLGAVAERVRAHGAGWVVPSIDEAVQRLAEVARSPELLEPLAERVRGFRHLTLEENAELHRRAYLEAGLLAGMGRSCEVDPAMIDHLASRWIASSAERLKPAQLSPGMLPSPAYQKRSWYRHFLKIKQLLPASLRRYGRDALLRRQYRTWRVLHLDRQAQASGVHLLKRAFNETTWLVRDGAAEFVFSLKPLPSSKVRLIRFRILQELEGEATARIGWAHAPDAAFEESKSARVLLDGRPGEWREYLLRVDSPRLAASWRAGDFIYRLRFAPTDSPGVISIGPIELGG